MKKTRIGPLPELLAGKGVLPPELARAAGVEVRAIHRLIEGQTKSMATEKLQAIAAALKIEFGEFCELVRLQRDLRGLLRVREDLLNFQFSIEFWRPAEAPEARRWAPPHAVVQSVIDKLKALLEVDFHLPPDDHTPPAGALSPD